MTAKILKEDAKAVVKGSPWYVTASMVVSLALFVGGFLIPPMGEIDGSVLTAVGELLGGTTLLVFVVNIPVYIGAGVKAKISHGATSISVAADEVDEEAEEM